MSSISEIITQRRKELGLSQQYISDALGYCVQTISKWEKGKSIPSLLSWGALAKVLQIDLESLIDGKLKSEYNNNCLNYSFSYEKFANNLRIQRKTRNMTQKELAAKLSVSYQTLLTWEKGTTFPNIEQFKKLSAVIGLSYDELYFGESNLVVSESNINTNTDQETSKKIKFKFWPKVSKTSIALTFTFVIIFGVTSIVKNNPFNQYNQPNISNLSSSNIVSSNTAKDSLIVESNTSSQNTQSNTSSNLPSGDIVSSTNSVSEVYKGIETLEKPYNLEVECERYFYESIYSDIYLEKAEVPVINNDSNYIKSVGCDYTYHGYSFLVISATSGVVIYNDFDAVYGNVLAVEHESGVKTIYASLGAIYVDKGQKVKQGERIGATGESLYTKGLGSCLHFEVLNKNDKYINPVTSYYKDLTKL